MYCPYPLVLNIIYISLSHPCHWVPVNLMTHSHLWKGVSMSMWVTVRLLIECWQLTWFVASQLQWVQHTTYTICDGWDRVVWGGYMPWKWAGCLVDMDGDGHSKGCTCLLQNWLPPDIIKKKMEIAFFEEGNIDENGVLGPYWPPFLGTSKVGSSNQD